MLLVVSCAALLVGCDGSTPAGESTSTPAGLPDDYTVPPVADPLEPGVFVAEPCSLLTSEQRTELELPVAEPDDWLGGVICRLGAEGDLVPPATLRISADSSLSGMVAMCRSENPPPGCEDLTPTTFEGYPALSSTLALEIGDGCGLDVAVTDEATLRVFVSGPSGSCERVNTIATLSLAALRAGP